MSAAAGLLDQVRRSIYAPPFYAALPGRPGGAAVRYFLLLTALLALVYWLTLLPGLIAFHQQAAEALETAVATYPDELVVEVRNGRAQANVPQPYFVPMPAAWRGRGTPSNLLVIDTTRPFTFTERNRYETVAYLSSDALVLKNQNGSDRSIDLAQLGGGEPVRIDKPLVRAGGDYARPWFGLIGPVLVPLTLLGVWISYLGRMLYLLLFAFVIWLLTRLAGQRLDYGGAYVAGLHAMTLALLVDLVVHLTAPLTGFRGFPFMFSLITGLVVLANYLPLRPAAPVSPPTAAPPLPPV